MRYLSYLEGEPTLEAYRLSHNPREDYGVVFICPFAVVTGESGRMYQLMRGIMARDKGGILNFGIYEVDGTLDDQGPLSLPYSQAPPHEPYWVEEDERAVSYVSDHCRYDFGTDRYRWLDAGGQVELQGERLGRVSTFWVPRQEGLPLPQLLRSHAAKVTGTIADDPVEGLLMIDYIYSRPDAMWSEMGMMTKLHNLWLNWLVEYEDGSYEGGYAWRGRPGSGFAAAHHIVDGKSTARSDAEILTSFTERGSVESLTLRLGEEVTVEFAQHGSCDWPLHTCGTVTSISRDKEVARSWNYTEFFPLNYADFIAYMDGHQRLYGRPASFKAVMKGARVVDQRLVFD